MRDKKLVELYAFAVRYARSFRNTYIEVDDLAHEMMVAVMKASWKSDAYATQVMKNRFYDLMKRRKIEGEYRVPYESPEVQSKYTCEDERWEARIHADHVFSQLPIAHADALLRLLKGEPAGVSPRTAYRYLHEARELAGR